MGIIASAAAAKSSGGSTFIIFIILIIGAMYFLVMRPGKKRQQRAQQQQSSVQPGARVRTTAGMYGTIIEGDADNVLVEFAPGVRIKMMRRAIMSVVPDDEPDGFRPTVADDPSADTGQPGSSDNREDLSI